MSNSGDAAINKERCTNRKQVIEMRPHQHGSAMWHRPMRYLYIMAWVDTARHFEPPDGRLTRPDRSIHGRHAADARLLSVGMTIKDEDS